METVVLVEGGSQLIPLQIYTVSICHYVTCDIYVTMPAATWATLTTTCLSLQGPD